MEKMNIKLDIIVFLIIAHILQNIYKFIPHFHRLILRDVILFTYCLLKPRRRLVTYDRYSNKMTIGINAFKPIFII